MRTAERVLLYVVAFLMAGLLLFDRGEANSTAPERPQAAQPSAEAGNADPGALSPPAAPSTSGAPIRETIPGKSLILNDAQGKPRIELSIGKDGDPRIILRNEAGADVVSLATGAGGAAQISLGAGPQKATLGVDREGDLSLSLQNGERNRLRATAYADGRSEVVVSGPAELPSARLSHFPEGRAELQLEHTGTESTATVSVTKEGLVSTDLKGQTGARAHMLVNEDGETEVGVAGSTGEVESLMRTDEQGAAEMGLLSRVRKGGPALYMLPSGDMGVRVKGDDGVTGPVMQLFPDGLAEIAVTAPDGKSGPALMRLPNGVSTIAVRAPDGSPGPSLVHSPDGTSLIAVAARNGKAQAILRAKGDGQPMLIVLDGEGRPLAMLPAPVATSPQPAADNAKPKLK